MNLDKDGKPIILQYPPEDVVNKLTKECEDLFHTVVRSDVASIKARWALGRKLVIWKEMHRHWYGQGLVEKLAGKMGISDKTLYSFIHVAEIWPKESDFDAYVEEQVKFYGEARWYKIRLGRADPATDYKQYGSPEIHTDHILFSAESAISIMQRHLRHLAKNTETSSDQVEQAKGTLVNLGESFLSMAATIKYTPELGESVDIEPIELTIEDRLWTDAETERFFSWIRTLPCAACGRGGGIQCAHLPKTRAVGDMLHVVPLCVLHHTEQHQHGINTFMEQWGDRIMDWWAKFPSMYWRYNESESNRNKEIKSIS